MSRWGEYYKQKAFNPDSVKKFELKYAPFISQLVNASKSHISPSYIEFGCGTGIVSRLVQNLRDWQYFSQYSSHILLDIDLEMLKMAAILGVRKRNFEYLEHDIRDPICQNPLYFQVAHSHGVLEHFSDHDINRVVRNMRDCASSVICYVPGHRYGKPCTDERLMTPKEWKKICNPKEIIEFNEGYDLILKW
jgi:SAM-dependent methyltransferase